MKKIILFVAVLFMAGCGTSRDVLLPCKIPDRLPAWNELVIRLWGSDQITPQTFLKNFSILGEHGERFLRAQGYDPRDLEPLGRCLVWHFKA